MDKDSVDSAISSHDPGWNDPPLFSYDASKSGGQPKRGHVLNKRVAFPLGPKSESTSKIPTTNPSHPLTMPPLPPVSALPPSSSLPCSKPEEAPSNSGLELIPPPVLSKQEGIQRVMENLTSVLESAPADIKVRLKGTSRNNLSSNYITIF
uniref:Uncharacterized protein n=1 Tax=Timema poppense TaxID=170557 RepID=A0A7R9GWG0_TIMPO|nr:unnamed protein product [Timema poppensis]